MQGARMGEQEWGGWQAGSGDRTTANYSEDRSRQAEKEQIG